jgi:2-methylisocitrate lyase-like PEP mutase family enzyme
VEREFDFSTMEQIGVRIALLPFHALYAAIGAMRKTLDRLQTGTAPCIVSQEQLSHEQFRDFIDFNGAMELERRYL